MMRRATGGVGAGSVRRARWSPVVAVPLLLVALIPGGPAAAATSSAAAAMPERGSVVVALGDSAASGDGAGDYEPGTRGERGNWCHRSRHAWVHHTGLAAESVNLACSGAGSADVSWTGPARSVEGSQARRLADLARRQRVRVVVVQVGANDAAALTDTAFACVRALLDPWVPPCRETIGPLVERRMAATAEAVAVAVREVRVVLRDAGYPSDTYELVVVSYAAPVSERMVAAAAGRGCPFSRADAAWARTELFPALSSALAGVASRSGARFLDLTRATEGREACALRVRSQEWQRRLTVDPEALVHGGLDGFGLRLAQQSFHPTAAAHAGVGHCVGALVRSTARSGACVATPGGRTELRPPGVGDGARAVSPGRPGRGVGG